MVTRVKICGLTRHEDAELAISLGAFAVGMVREPSSPRYMAIVPEWWDCIGSGSLKVAVYGPWSVDDQAHRFDRFQAISWSGDAPPPDRRIQVVREGAIPEGTGVCVLDAHSDRAYGGTGKTVDWAWAASLVKSSDAQVILAGGLTPDNVADAIRAVRPYAVDVSSGVESAPGIKDPAKLRDFFQAVQSV